MRNKIRCRPNFGLMSRDVPETTHLSLRSYSIQAMEFVCGYSKMKSTLLEDSISSSIHESFLELHLYSSALISCKPCNFRRDHSIMKDILHVEQRTFLPECQLQFNRFSWNTLHGALPLRRMFCCYHSITKVIFMNNNVPSCLYFGSNSRIFL
jgi:hypothetical protein